MREEWGSDWASLSPRKRRRAEEDYLLQCQSEDLMAFRAEFTRQVSLKRQMMREWGDAASRRSRESSIVVPPATIASFVELYGQEAFSRLYREVLFVDPAYPAYVQRYTQQMLAMPAQAPTPLTVSALVLVNRYYWFAALAGTCSALRKDSARFRQQSRPRISWRQKQGTLRSLSDNSADPFVRDAQAELDQNRNAPEGMRAYWRTIDAPIEPLDDLVPWGEDNDLGGMGRSSSLPNLWMIMPHGVTPMILETFECTIRLA